MAGYLFYVAISAALSVSGTKINTQQLILQSTFDYTALCNRLTGQMLFLMTTNSVVTLIKHRIIPVLAGYCLLLKPSHQGIQGVTIKTNPNNVSSLFP